MIIGKHRQTRYTQTPNCIVTSINLDRQRQNQATVSKYHRLMTVEFGCRTLRATRPQAASWPSGILLRHQATVGTAARSHRCHPSVERRQRIRRRINRSSQKQPAARPSKNHRAAAPRRAPGSGPAQRVGPLWRCGPLWRSRCAGSVSGRLAASDES